MLEFSCLGQIGDKCLYIGIKDLFGNDACLSFLLSAILCIKVLLFHENNGAYNIEM